MPFNLVYYSQNDPKWKGDRLGFGAQESETIGYVGCALTSVAITLSGHGYMVTPKELNQKLKSIDGFVGSGIRWHSVTQLFPQIRLNTIVKCNDTPAPLAQIDAALAAGQPAIICVDSTPAEGLLTHYVVLIARKGDDYLMLDPWPYQPDPNKETYLMPRYSQGKTLQRSIFQIVLFENINADGKIMLPGQKGATTPTTSAAQTQGQPAPVSAAGLKTRVKADVNLGLNIRSSENTASKANIVDTARAGDLLTIVEPNGWMKIGAINQWVRVRTKNGKDGLAAAWFLEKVPGEKYPEAAGVTVPANEAGSSSTPGLTVMVKAKVGGAGLKVYETASTRSKVVSKEGMRAKLTVIEDAASARRKVGKAGKWLFVQTAGGGQGFAQAEFLKEL